MKNHLFRAPIAAALLLASCGYHLAGQENSAIPRDVHTLSIVPVGDAAKHLLPAFRRFVKDRAGHFSVVESGGSDAQLRLEDVSESFVPVAYDNAGVAVSYRMTFQGGISLWRGGKRIWFSSLISVQDDVYVVGDPVSIEASKDRLRRDLERQWIREAWLRLASGF